MPQLVMTSVLKQILVALLIAGAASGSARPVLLEERLAKLAEVPALVIPQRNGPLT
jgi:hypothetical protein